MAGLFKFEKQTMVYRHYPKADTLVIWQQYEGIYGADGREDLSPTEIEQLHSVVKGQRTFFFSNWVTEYNAQKLADEVAQMRKELQTEELAEEEKSFKRQLIALCELITKNTQIKNGPFYLNAEGKLSATQEVTVTRVSRIIAAANQVILAGVQLEVDSNSLDQSDPEYLPLVEKVLETKLQVIQLQGQRLQVRWPLTAGLFQDEDSQKHVKQFQRLEARVMFQDALMTVEMGKLKGGEAKLGGLLPDKKFKPNAVEHVKQRYELKAPYDPTAARVDFFRRMDGRYKK